MFDLAYPFDDSVEINGASYELDMSFDNVLRLFDLLEDKTINNYAKVETGLLMLINNSLDDYDPQEKANVFIELFKNVIGKGAEEVAPVDIDGNPMPAIPAEDKKAFDLAQDAEYIYASFMHCYQIDLFEAQGELHWNKFKALLNGLGEESIFSRVVSIRTAELPSGKGMQKERERLKKLKQKFSLKEDDNHES